MFMDYMKKSQLRIPHPTKHSIFSINPTPLQETIRHPTFPLKKLYSITPHGGSNDIPITPLSPDPAEDSAAVVLGPGAA